MDCVSVSAMNKLLIDLGVLAQAMLLEERTRRAFCRTLAELRKQQDWRLRRGAIAVDDVTQSHRYPARTPEPVVLQNELHAYKSALQRPNEMATTSGATSGATGALHKWCWQAERLAVVQGCVAPPRRHCQADSARPAGQCAG